MSLKLALVFKSTNKKIVVQYYSNIFSANYLNLILFLYLLRNRLNAWFPLPAILPRIVGARASAASASSASSPLSLPPSLRIDAQLASDWPKAKKRARRDSFSSTKPYKCLSFFANFDHTCVGNRIIFLHAPFCLRTLPQLQAPNS